LAWSLEVNRNFAVFAKELLAAVPDFKYELRSWFARGKWAAIEWVMSGTHKGDFPHVRADEPGPPVTKYCINEILSLPQPKLNDTASSSAMS